MARSLRAAAVLSLCAILVPTGCGSPTSSPEVQPNAAVTGEGTVVTTVRDVISIGQDKPVVVYVPCLNEGEFVEISGELGVVHRLRLEPISGGKTYLLNLNTQVWSQGIRGVGLQAAAELLAMGADKFEVTEEVVALPTGLAVDFNLDFAESASNAGGVPHAQSTGFGLSTGLTIEIAEDFGITTTLESVDIVCPPPADADDGTIRSTTKEVLFVAEEVTTPCLGGVDESVAISGVMGVLHRLTLEPVVGKETYLMDLETHVWSQGIQLVGLQSAAAALAVGADKVEVMEEVTLPVVVQSPLLLFLHETLDTTPRGDLVQERIVQSGLVLEIVEDFGITTTLDGIEVICPPPPVVDG
jgi:hypothetical protein